FTGGEPLMTERFSELVLYTRLKGKSVTVISNGNYSDYTAYQQLVDLGVDLFELPIHSANPENHDYMTRKSGSWEKSVSIIKQLQQTQARVVCVIVLTKSNHSEIIDTLEFISSLGISSVMLNRFNIGGLGRQETEKVMPSRDELSIAYKKASDHAKRLKLSISSNVCTPVCVLNPKDYRMISFATCSSDFSKRPITLDSEGNVRFCNHSPTVLGNIHTTPLEEILHSPEARQWEEIIPSFCAGCKAYSKCKAGCRAASEQVGLSLEHPDPIIGMIGNNKAALNL
ncbi:MAG: radical SAM protein, partial [Bacteroidota bacterium]